MGDPRLEGALILNRDASEMPEKRTENERMLLSIMEVKSLKR